ncbi:MAG: lysophospholipid acyltransferase family protein [Pyrinomonadaceae bacterium]
MQDEVAIKRKDNGLAASKETSMPTAAELSLLSAVERMGFSLVYAMNSETWKTFWTFCQRHIGSLWIYLATYNLMNVFGVENFERTDPTRAVVLVANHRSFFDMYTVSSVLFRRTSRPMRLYFPVRAKFFYDNLVGWAVNLIMGWWAMYPPFFREKGEGQKRAFDRFTMRELVRICSERRPNVVGFHPEGGRNRDADPYSYLRAQPGIGKVIFEARPQVIPVFIAGLGNDLPKQIAGNWTGGEEVRIYFGEEVDLGDYYGRRDSIRTHKEIADRLMEKIAELGETDRTTFQSKTSKGENTA